MPRNKILLRRLPNARRVQLLNGRVSFAKCDRLNRDALASIQVRTARTYVRKIIPRRQRIRTLYRDSI